MWEKTDDGSRQLSEGIAVVVRLFFIIFFANPKRSGASYIKEQGEKWETQGGNIRNLEIHKYVIREMIERHRGCLRVEEGEVKQIRRALFVSYGYE